jgi:hypothetical protein
LITNTASISGNEDDLNSSNDSVSEDTTVLSADEVEEDDGFMTILTIIKKVLDDEAANQ